MEDGPWCFVDDKSFERIIEPCAIAKCSDSIWMYIFLALGSLMACLTIYILVTILVKRKRNNGMTNIQNVGTERTFIQNGVHFALFLL